MTSIWTGDATDLNATRSVPVNTISISRIAIAKFIADLKNY